jgi:hypothetical protein
VTGLSGAALQTGFQITTGNQTVLANITGQSSGTAGSTGVYTIDGAPQLLASSSLGATIAAGSTTAFGSTGFKGGVHPSVLIDLAVRSNCHIWFSLPLYISNAEVLNIANYFANSAALRNAGLQVWFEPGNELWNTTEINYWLQTNSLPFGLNQPVEWGHYRAAQMMQQVYNAFGGATGRNRWRGIVGCQCANTAVVTSALAGINYYLANEAPGGTTITTLFDAGAIAPYLGPQSDDENAKPTSGSFTVTPGNPTTITYPSAHGYTSAQVKRFFCSGGTGASLINNLDLTVTVSSGTVLTVAVNSTSLTFSGNQFSCEAPFFDIIDQSIALHTSTPATYPSIYSYFIQQAAKAYITGSSDAQVNGTWSPSTAIPALLTQVQSQALILNSNGLQIVNYEGGYNVGPGVHLVTLNSPGGAYDFILNWVFDKTTPIDPTYNVGTMYSALFGLQRQVWSQYPARYTDNLPLAIDAWASLRFFGDEANATYQAMVAQCALTPYVDPVSPVFGGVATYAGDATNYFFSASSANPATDTLTTAVIGTAAIDVFVLCNHTGGTVTGVTVDGVAATAVVGTAIWHAAVSAGANTRTVVVTTTGGSFQNRSFYVITVSGLSSTSAIQSSTASAKNTTLAVTKGQLILTTGRLIGTPGSYAATTGVTQGVVQTLFSDINNSNSSAMAAFVSPFSASSFTVDQGVSGTISVGTFR